MLLDDTDSPESNLTDAFAALQRRQENATTEVLKIIRARANHLHLPDSGVAFEAFRDPNGITVRLNEGGNIQDCLRVDVTASNDIAIECAGSDGRLGLLGTYESHTALEIIRANMECIYDTAIRKTDLGAALAAFEDDNVNWLNKQFDPG